MKYLKYKHQSIFPLWGRVKLNFRDKYEKPAVAKPLVTVTVTVTVRSVNFRLAAIS